MILVDTGVWVNHFHRSNPRPVAQLNRGTIACHPFVIGELACGNLGNRVEIIGLLQALPVTPQVEPDEILEFIESRNLMGKGLGYVDLHLLASVILGGVGLWTADKRLKAAAGDLKVAYQPV
jgi:predicted nucleic acid-binding protein